VSAADAAVVVGADASAVVFGDVDAGAAGAARVVSDFGGSSVVAGGRVDAGGSAVDRGGRVDVASVASVVSRDPVPVVAVRSPEASGCGRSPVLPPPAAQPPSQRTRPITRPARRPTLPARPPTGTIRRDVVLDVRIDLPPPN
jgi:hypothetical protein